MSRKILGLLLILMVVGCAPITPGTTYVEPESFEPDKDIETANFKSIEELKSFLKSNSVSTSFYGGAMRTMEAAFDSSAGATAGSPKMLVDPVVFDESVDFSETNVQVEGIDEADIIKTDGNYIYTISGKTLFVIKAYPGQDAEIISQMNLDNRPTSLFIKDDLLVLFGEFSDLNYFKEYDFSPTSDMTYFDVYDISNKENLELIKEYKFEGRYFQGRMIGDQIYLVVTSNPNYRIGIPTPIIMDGDVLRNVPVKNVFYYSIPYNNPQFATVHAVDLQGQISLNSKTVTIEHSPNMYMSHNNIYITYTEYINEYEIQQKIIKDMMLPRLNNIDKLLVEKIEGVDDDILSVSEKNAKIMQIINSYLAFLPREEQDELQDDIELKLKETLEKYNYLEYTIINKISIDDGAINVEANGKVPGSLINQFSMDEYEGILRIGTTVNARWSRLESERTESTNHVLTLNKDLKIMNHLSDLAEGERIYSTRFMGDKLYMVTFRQVDPFFVIDLSNPFKIESLGELKIPGFSRYLHPFDENTIIGIGRDATETGRTQGLKISLFDVSDVQDPKEVAKFVTEERYTQSTAEYEHKAFLFSKDKELLVIPAYSYSHDNKDDNYNGAMVFKITKDEIELRGLIDHSSAAQNRWQSAVERSLYIEDLLYTKSAQLLRINSLEDLSSVKDIELEAEEDGNMPIF